MLKEHQSLRQEGQLSRHKCVKLLKMQAKRFTKHLKAIYIARQMEIMKKESKKKT